MSLAHLDLHRHAARRAKLRYVDDRAPGYTRRRRGKGFGYVDAHGRPLRDRATLERIRHLAIPPAWTQVWICPFESGHIQATGRDARGRKQYRYHARWREHRDETKFERIVSFAEALPQLRHTVAAELAATTFSRRKVLAAVVRLLELTLIRVGNEEYARQNGSFGLTTLRDHHVSIKGAAIHFHFRGKSGVEHAVDVRDRRLARIIQRCQDLPGELLFQYRDESGALCRVESSDVNEFIHEVTGVEFSAKDVRTWSATVLMACELRALEEATSATAAKRNVVAAVKRVSKELRNTPTVCRKCYVHPAIIEAYTEGRLASALGEVDGAALEPSQPALSKAERAVLALLRRGAVPVAA